MKKFILVMLAAVAIGFGTSFSFTKATSQDNHAGHDSTTPASITTDGSIAGKSADKTVSLMSDKASPDEVTVEAGQVVQFNSRDGKSHRLALGQGGSEHEHTSATDSGVFGADEAWKVRFDKPGTYYIHDHFNPAINILIVAYKP